VRKSDQSVNRVQQTCWILGEGVDGIPNAFYLFKQTTVTVMSSSSRRQRAAATPIVRDPSAVRFDFSLSLASSEL
jgi:hypothetical protein